MSRIKLNSNSAGSELFNLLINEKKKLIAAKKIINKKDNNVYPVVNVPFKIPSDWFWCYLSDISIIQEGPGIRKHQYSADGIQFLTVTNILEGSVDLEKSKKYISYEQYKNYSHFTIDKGDIVTACSGGSWGKSAIYDLDQKIILNTSTLRLRFFNDLGDNKYLYYLTKMQYFKDSLSKYSTGQQPNYGYFHYSKIPIPLPPLPEQQRIVSILDKAFAAIDKAKANAEQNLKNAKELFESYLQGVFENGNWETKTIEMVCDEIFAGGDAPKNNYSLEPNEKHNIPIYANAVKDRGLYGYTDFAKVTKPCVTITARGSGTGHTELRNEHFLPIVRLIVCIPDIKQISTEFLKYTIDNLVIQRSGSAIPQLTVPMIKDYKIPVPSIEEQKLIIEKAETLKQQKENLENVYLKKIDALEELKKSILQKAFSGELTTSEEIAV